ncbi:MAG: FAD-binding oxidoreductase [Cocleimonas sp.]
MTNKYDAIVIGGGIVGCGVLYGLAERGMTNTLLLEKNELTAGSTWHAAGNCTHFGHDAKITRLYVDSLETYRRAEAESGHSIDFHKTGSLRLASTAEEMAAYHRLTPIYKKLNIPYKVVSTEEIPQIHPLMNIEGVLGAAYTPDDGHVDPTGATLAMANSAKARGAKILRQHPVGAFSKTVTGHWEVTCGDEVFLADRVVVAASFWAREMLQSLDIDMPLYAMEHHEIITESHSDIESLNFELPTIRDPLIPGNIRQEANGLLFGVYEKNPVAWNTDGIPPEFGQELLIPNTDRLMDHLEKCMWRFPLIESAGIKKVNNGPLCYPPDGFPVVGPVSSHAGLWMASGFHVGIGTGGGATQFLSDWMVNGKPPYSLDAVHPKRFNAPIPTDEAVASILAHYSAGYTIPKNDVEV